jgi:hypothetical protein
LTAPDRATGRLSGLFGDQEAENQKYRATPLRIYFVFHDNWRVPVAYATGIAIRTVFWRTLRLGGNAYSRLPSQFATLTVMKGSHVICQLSSTSARTKKPKWIWSYSHLRGCLPNGTSCERDTGLTNCLQALDSETRRAGDGRDWSTPSNVASRW